MFSELSPFAPSGKVTGFQSRDFGGHSEFRVCPPEYGSDRAWLSWARGLDLAPVSPRMKNLAFFMFFPFLLSQINKCLIIILNFSLTYI